MTQRISKNPTALLVSEFKQILLYWCQSTASTGRRGQNERSWERRIGGLSVAITAMLNPLFCVRSHDLFRKTRADRGQIGSRARAFRPH
jgi:hypothetical protein